MEILPYGIVSCCTPVRSRPGLLGTPNRITEPVGHPQDDLGAGCVTRFRINVLGSSRGERYKQHNKLDKIYALADFVRALPEDPRALVLFVDAYDVLLAAQPIVLVAARQEEMGRFDRCIISTL